MRSRFLASIALCIALALLLCGCTAAVSGRVVGHTSGNPIEGATVSASGVSTQTGALGEFTLSGLSGGTTTGSVSASGFPEASFAIDLSRGEASQTVEIQDAAVTVSLKELATEPQEIASATVTLDGRVMSAGQSLENVAPGTRLLTVSAADHEAYSATVTIAPGENSVVASLSLTPLATYKRCWAAMQFHRDGVSYKYIHPDERKKTSLKKWKTWMAGTEILSVKWGAVRTLAKWKSPVTKKTYAGVAEIDRSERYQVTGTQYSDFGRIYTENFSQHWSKLNGIWYFLHKSI
jgi:hypothetical protein